MRSGCGECPTAWSIDDSRSRQSGLNLGLGFIESCIASNRLGHTLLDGLLQARIEFISLGYLLRQSIANVYHCRQVKVEKGSRHNGHLEQHHSCTRSPLFSNLES